MFRPRRAVLVALVALGIGAAVEPAMADCAATMRPATAEEKKGYADAFALFVRVAPPAPPGWEHHDSAANGVLEGPVCAEPGERITQWSFSRTFSSVEGAAERRAETERRAVAAPQGQALAKSNEAKLSEVQKKMDALVARLQALATT